MIYVRWFPGDYLRDTIHLSWLEDCAYRRLLDLYYTQGRALTANRKVLYRQVRANTPEEMAAVESVLSQFFFERRGSVFNSRASKELRRNNEITALRVKAAKAKAYKAANALHVQTTSSAIPEPEPEPEGSTVPEHVLSQTDRLGIPLSLWLQFRKLRESLHRPILAGAEDHIFAELIQFQADGENPTEILTRAVRTSSWKLSPNGDKHETKAQTRQRRTEEAIQRAIQGPGGKVARQTRRPLPH